MVQKEFQEFAEWLNEEIYKTEKASKDNSLNFDYDINKSCNYFDAYSDIRDEIEHNHPAPHTEVLRIFAIWLEGEIKYYKANANNKYLNFYLDPADKWSDYAEAYENALNEVNREIKERRSKWAL